MTAANRNVILSLMNFADSAKDIYILFVRNRRGLRKLSSEAKGRLKLYQQDILKAQAQIGAMNGNKFAQNVCSNNENSLSGDCILLKYSKDLAKGSSSGIFQRLEPDLFHTLIEKFAASSSMKLFENVTDQKLNVTQEHIDEDNNDNNNNNNNNVDNKGVVSKKEGQKETFAQMKCFSCGETCSLICGLTSCCNKSINDVLFDIFDEMYFNRRKSFAIKFDEEGGGNGDRQEERHDSGPLFYVGNYAAVAEES